MTVEAFDGIQIKTIQNVVFLVEHDFGADPKHKSFYPKYIEKTGDKMLEIAIEIHAQAKFANSIHPENKDQYKIRAEAQKKARALVFALEGQYHAVLAILDVDDNKFVDHIKHLRHQSNCIKSWIDKDKETYKKRKWWKS